MRIIPLVALVNWFLHGVSRQIVSKTPGAVIFEMCPKLGWQSWSLFYAYDHQPYNTMCAPWLWYLIVDFQCFMIVPFILLFT